MQDESNNPTKTPNFESILAEAKTLLAELREQKQSQEGIKATLSEILGSAKLSLTDIQTAKTTALAAQTRIVDEQAVIATKSAHIQGAQDHADKIRINLDGLQVTAAGIITQIEGLFAKTQVSSKNASELTEAILAQSKETKAAQEKAIEAREEATSAANTAKTLAEKSETVEARVSEYESKLAELELHSKEQLDNITGLLPGATVAGLAHAFDDRRKTFLVPTSRWQLAFIGSIVAIVILALSGLWSVYKDNEVIGWDAIARLWIVRIPIGGALIWLALYSSRESALAKRLEEDYGYKAAIASSFLGFQKQMAEIGEKAPEGSPLAKLCADTLSTISSPPGRIYEKHQLTVTPAGEIANAVATAIGKSLKSEAKSEKALNNH
jgi:hypothetical protein